MTANENCAKQIVARIGTLEDMGARFTKAWKDAERGGEALGERITFLSLESFVSVMSPKRLELLRDLRAHGASSIRAVSTRLGRDYKSVHTDVTLLADAGLIDRTTEGKVAVTWDKVRAEMELV